MTLKRNISAEQQNQKHQQSQVSWQGQQAYADANCQTQTSVIGKQRQLGQHARVFTVILFCCFVVVLLLAILAGTNTYKSLYTMNEETNNERLSLTLLTNTVRANDSAQAVGEGQGPEGKSLVLSEEAAGNTYETRIYQYQGNIVEEYAIASKDYNPNRATVVTASEQFDFEYANGLLTLYTDAGHAQVALRSVEELDA